MSEALGDDAAERATAAKTARTILGRGTQVPTAADVVELASFINGPGEHGWSGELSTYALDVGDREESVAVDGDPRPRWRRVLDGWPLAELFAALVVGFVWLVYALDRLSFEWSVLLLLGVAVVNAAACRVRRWGRW